MDRPAVRMRRSTFGQVAQLVEQWTENPCVAGSIPALPISAFGQNRGESSRRWREEAGNCSTVVRRMPAPRCSPRSTFYFLTAFDCLRSTDLLLHPKATIVRIPLPCQTWEIDVFASQSFRQKKARLKIRVPASLLHAQRLPFILQGVPKASSGSAASVARNSPLPASPADRECPEHYRALPRERRRRRRRLPSSPQATADCR